MVELNKREALIVAKIDTLIGEAASVLATSERTYNGEFVDSRQFLRWSTSVKSLLQATFSNRSPHLTEFIANCSEEYAEDVRRGLGVLESAKRDIVDGFLLASERLISAEIHSDFIIMSKALFDAGYKHVSVSLSGAVLEDALRRTCNAKNIAVKRSDDISSLSHKLLDANGIDSVEMKHVRYWKGLRDLADHGHFEEINAKSSSDILAMIAGIGEFVVRLDLPSGS